MGHVRPILALYKNLSDGLPRVRHGVSRKGREQAQETHDRQALFPRVSCQLKCCATRGMKFVARHDAVYPQYRDLAAGS